MGEAKISEETTKNKRRMNFIFSNTELKRNQLSFILLSRDSTEHDYVVIGYFDDEATYINGDLKPQQFIKEIDKKASKAIQTKIAAAN